MRRAQAICLRAQSAAGAMLPPSQQSGLAGAAGYLGQSAAIAEAKTNELRALRIRSRGRLAGRWHRLIAAEGRFTAHLQSLGAAAAANDSRRLELVEADTVPEQELIGMTARLGVPLCAP
ncbi:MAG: hypothetical protein M3Z06_05370 [Actinomycetota bacterium]|nr:hypothetical protein [Actinomycetota bacterium]